MDWSSFWTGLLAGIVGSGALLVAVCAWWMRPYLKAARAKGKEAITLTAEGMWTGDGWGSSKKKGGQE